jgi:NIMA-interacting peptidyl-prolyl cis-trans isomerase 1
VSTTVEASAKGRSVPGSKVPDWAPWGVLAALVTVSLLVGMGQVPFGPGPGAKAQAAPPAGVSEPQAAPPAEPGAPAVAEGEELPAEFPTHMLARGAGEQAGPQTIEARHVLVQYQGSWRVDANLKRSRDEALKLAHEALERLRKGEDFLKVSQAYSDSEDVKARGGELGVLNRDTAMRAIAGPAFALEVGQLSEVVESPFGFHVIQRTK